MKNDTVRTDARLRKYVLFGLAAFVAIGVAAGLEFCSFLYQIRQLSITDPELAIGKLNPFPNILAIVNAVVSMLFAGYFLSVGIKTLKGGKYPPDGMRIIKGAGIRSLLDLMKGVTIWDFAQSVVMNDKRRTMTLFR